MKLITPPTQLPIQLDDAKAHLRVDHSDEDMLITSLIGAATDWVERFTGRTLVSQTWELSLDEFPTNEVLLAKVPVIDITSVYYDTTAGVETLIPSTDYILDARLNDRSWLLPESSWPSTFAGINAVRVRFRVGYVDTNDSPLSGEIPPAITAALLMYLQAFYERGSMDPDKQKSILDTGEMLLRQYRVETALA